MNPRVKFVIAGDDYTLDVTFSNGEVGLYDCTPLLDFGVFKELRDIRYFRQAFVSGGTVVWPHEQDICPDTLYEDSTKSPSLNAESATDSGGRRLPQAHADVSGKSGHVLDRSETGQVSQV